MMWNVIGGLYGYRKSWDGGCQGDVRFVHDVTGNGGSVADPDEGKSGNSETVW